MEQKIKQMARLSGDRLNQNSFNCVAPYLRKSITTNSTGAWQRDIYRRVYARPSHTKVGSYAVGAFVTKFVRRSRSASYMRYSLSWHPHGIRDDLGSGTPLFRQGTGIAGHVLKTSFRERYVYGRINKLIIYTHGTRDGDNSRACSPGRQPPSD